MLVNATILLTTALQWTTSYCTSVLHAAQYIHYIVVYLNTFKTLNPDLPWCPNHHTTLLMFGLMHSWWMFTYERGIGLLQK